MAWTAAVLCGLVLALSGAAFASTAGGGPYGPSQPAPCYPGSGCSKPCDLTSIVTQCESRDPDVTISYGTAAGCVYAGHIDWGDASGSQPVSFGSSAGGAETAVLTHRYGVGTRDYAAVLTGTESCGGTVESSAFSTSYDIGVMEGHYDLVAVGDSYSSGEGAGDYSAGYSGCHRSAVAWPRLLAQDTGKVASVLDLACSGTTSRGLSGGQAGKPDQISALRRTHASLVTVTIGGNDIHFAEVLQSCFLVNCVTNGRIAQLDRDIRDERDRLVTDYLTIARAAPDARLLVIGYPQLFPDPKDYRDFFECGYLTHVGPKPVYDTRNGAYRYDELLELAAADDLLDVTIDAAVVLADLRLEEHRANDRITYVSAYRALSGHELCTALPWLVNLELLHGALGDRQLGHPNADGQRAIAQVVAAYINHQL